MYKEVGPRRFGFFFFFLGVKLATACGNNYHCIIMLRIDNILNFADVILV
jgi:hypothetical protein